MAKEQLVVVETAKGYMYKLAEQAAPGFDRDPEKVRAMAEASQRYTNQLTEETRKALSLQTSPIIVRAAEVEELTALVGGDGAKVFSLNDSLIKGDEHITINRLTLLDFEGEDRKDGKVGNGETIDEQFCRLGKKYRGERVSVPDDVSETGGTFEVVNKKLREQEIDPIANIVAFDGSNGRKLESGVPLYAVHTGEASRMYGIEDIDLGPFGGGTPPAGYYAAKHSLLQVHDTIRSAVRERAMKGSFDEQRMLRILQSYGVTITDKDALFDYLININPTDTVRGMLSLLTPSTSQSRDAQALLQIPGLDMLHRDPSREMYIHGRKRDDHPVWKAMSHDAWQIFSQRSLALTGELIATAEEIIEAPIKASSIETFKHPDVQEVMTQQEIPYDASSTLVFSALGNQRAETERNRTFHPHGVFPYKREPATIFADSAR